MLSISKSESMRVSSCLILILSKTSAAKYIMAEAASCSVSAQVENGDENSDLSTSTDSKQLDSKAIVYQQYQHILCIGS